MNVVAIVRLATSLEHEAVALAADLGTSAYDERLKLSAGLPTVVLSTPDEPRAQALLRRLQARGHGAVIVRAAEVVASSAMISLRRFRLDEDALVATDLPDARLLWSDLSALLRATHRRRIESVESVKEKKFDLTRTLATGGLIMSKTTKREIATRIDDHEPVLYLFRHSRATPWILREQGTHYEGLGALLAPNSARNFTLTVEQLRARAPRATFDERLLKRKVPPAEIDLLAHLIAM